ncbi:MAG: cytidylate kinase-like family protein [Clostridiales Family XIII bacterium]|jgi:cytidylate kinase|nr:cytidylate kinase-like family protein [Clostridiales Family XIII bacterium]
MKRVITISREYGSGGRAIGKLAAEKLGFAFYDKDILKLAAQESGLAADYLTQTDENISGGSSLHLSIGDVFSYGSYSPDTMPMPDQIHVLLSKVISDIANKEPCVIVGRSSNYILRNRDDCLHVFIHASKEAKLARIINDFGVPAKNAEKELERTEKARASYYRHYSGLNRGLAKNFHISLDSGLFGLEACAEIITKLAQTV